jgi:hypothetical protein
MPPDRLAVRPNMELVNASPEIYKNPWTKIRPLRVSLRPPKYDTVMGIRG